MLPVSLTQYPRKVLSDPVVNVNWQLVLGNGVSRSTFFAFESPAKLREERAHTVRARANFFTAISPKLFHFYWDGPTANPTFVFTVNGARVGWAIGLYLGN